MSCSEFSYANLTLSKAVMIAAETVTVSVDVKNEGPHDGKEAVLLFISDLQASIAPDMKRLKRFKKISLKAGALQTVKFTIEATEFSFITGKIKGSPNRESSQS
jgi:beta-glucosidase